MRTRRRGPAAHPRLRCTSTFWRCGTRWSCTTSPRVFVECPLDEINRPRASGSAATHPAHRRRGRAVVRRLAWELVTCRKFAPPARNYAVARLVADVGLRINEARMLDLDDVRWELGRFGTLNVLHGMGSRRKGPKPRLVPLIRGADPQSALVYQERAWPVRHRSVRTPDAVVPVRAQEDRWHQHARDCGRVPPCLGRGPLTGICQCGRES